MRRNNVHRRAACPGWAPMGQHYTSAEPQLRTESDTFTLCCEMTITELGHRVDVVTKTAKLGCGSKELLLATDRLG